MGGVYDISKETRNKQYEWFIEPKYKAIMLLALK